MGKPTTSSTINAKMAMKNVLKVENSSACFCLSAFLPISVVKALNNAETKASQNQDSGTEIT